MDCIKSLHPLYVTPLSILPALEQAEIDTLITLFKTWIGTDFKAIYTL